MNKITQYELKSHTMIVSVKGKKIHHPNKFLVICEGPSKIINKIVFETLYSAAFLVLLLLLVLVLDFSNCRLRLGVPLR